jgi:hypothetical protein
MIPETLAQLERDLRRAAASHDYRAVERRALSFGDAARLEIGKLPSGDPAIARIAKRVVDVLECSRILTLVGRTKATDELRGLSFLRPYIPKRLPRNPRLRLHV